MLYGSMLGLLGAAVLGSLAASYLGLSSLQDLKPASDSHDGLLKRWLQPYKERLQVRTLKGVSDIMFGSIWHLSAAPVSAATDACLLCVTAKLTVWDKHNMCTSSSVIHVQLGCMLPSRLTSHHPHSYQQKVAELKYCQEHVWRPRFLRNQARIASSHRGLYAATTHTSASQTQVLISKRLMCFSGNTTGCAFAVSVSSSHATAVFLHCIL